MINEIGPTRVPSKRLTGLSGHRHFKFILINAWEGTMDWIQEEIQVCELVKIRMVGTWKLPTFLTVNRLMVDSDPNTQAHGKGK